MSVDLRAALDNSLWLCEPMALHRLIAQVSAFPGCPSPREIAKERRRRIDLARAAPENAIHPRDIIDPLPLTAAIGAGGGRRAPAVNGRIGIVGLHGPVSMRLSAAMLKAGGTSLEEAGAAFSALMADSGIAAVVWHCASPGGEHHGVEELSDKIFSAMGKKPIIAIADPLCCSAAFWVASACEMVFATDSADVGSVGVYVAHADQSRALDAAGVSVTLVSAGRFKTELSPFAPLGVDAKAFLQQQVDGCYSDFLSAVARNRGTTKANVAQHYGQGRTMTARQALSAGVVDGIATFEELLGQLGGVRTKGGQTGRSAGTSGRTPSSAASAAPSHEVQRLRAEQERRRQEAIEAFGYYTEED